MTLFNLLGTLLCLALAGLLAWAFVRNREREQDRARLEQFLVTQEPVPASRPAPQQDMLPAGLQRKLSRAGLALTPRHLVWIAACLGLAMLAALVAAGPTAGLLAGALLALLAWAGLEYRARRRMRLLADCMIGFLERIRQLLVVGNSLAVAVQRAAENSPPIVAAHLAPTVRRIANGNGVGESIERCAAELDIYELHLLATAARTNLRFGGSMGTILRNIIENIRKRAAIERELRASTAEIRASAWVLGLLPILVASFVMFTNHKYARWFLDTTTGHHMLVYALLSQLAGIWCMRQIIRTRY